MLTAEYIDGLLERNHIDTSLLTGIRRDHLGEVHLVNGPSRVDTTRGRILVEVTTAGQVTALGTSREDPITRWRKVIDG